MRTSTRAQIEEQLTCELRRVEAPYRQALEIVESVSRHAASGYDEIFACLSRLQPVMQHINHVEAILSPVRGQWLALAVRPGVELRSILDVHETLLRALIDGVGRLEQQLSQARQKMLPEVDAAVQRQRMRRAYRQPSRS